jgi:sulfite exporter TauE/SafE
MGLLTPFLPCGPLYAMFALALLSGSAVKGAEFAITFGLGTVPLLWLAQWQMDRLRVKLTPLAIGRVQRGLAFATAVILAWRLHATIPPPWYGQEPRPAVDSAEKKPPSCCH